MRTGKKPFAFDTYAGPVHAWTWFAAAVRAQEIAKLRVSRGEDVQTSSVVEIQTGRRWTIDADSDLVAMHDAWKAETV